MQRLGFDTQIKKINRIYSSFFYRLPLSTAFFSKDVYKVQGFGHQNEFEIGSGKMVHVRPFIIL